MKRVWTGIVATAVLVVGCAPQERQAPPPEATSTNTLESRAGILMFQLECRRGDSPFAS